MTDYTRAEVLEALQEILDDVGWGELNSELYSSYGSRHTYTITLRGEEVRLKGEENYGGLDLGSEAWMVIRIGDQLFRKEGYYASHYGYDWDGTFEEVEAKPKTITVYEPK